MVLVPSTEVAVKRIQHTLTAAELLTLQSAPVQLLPAPGPNKAYLIHTLFAFFNPLTTAYTPNTNAILGPIPVNSSQAYVTIAGLLTSAVKAFGSSGPGFLNGVTADIANQPLKIGTDGSNNLTLGDGTLTVVIYYTTEDTA